jgi:hypothetical protein
VERRRRWSDAIYTQCRWSAFAKWNNTAMQRRPHDVQGSGTSAKQGCPRQECIKVLSSVAVLEHVTKHYAASAQPFGVDTNTAITASTEDTQHRLDLIPPLHPASPRTP